MVEVGQTSMSEDEVYLIEVLIDELKNEDVQVRATHTHTRYTVLALLLMNEFPFFW